MFSCMAFGGCSAEKYIEKGNFVKAYERALKDGDKSLQEKILCESALYGALHYSGSTGNSSDVVCGAYYLIYIDSEGHFDQLVVLEYEDILSYTKTGYRYQKYELYKCAFTTWGYEGSSDEAKYDKTVYNGVGDIESCFSDLKRRMDISDVVNNGKKFTTDEITQMQNKRLEEYTALGELATVNTEFSFVVEEKTADVEAMLQGKWDMNAGYTFADLMCYIDGRTYRAIYEDSKGNQELDITIEGAIKIEGKRIVFTNSRGTTDFELIYEVHHGRLIMLEKASSSIYRVIVKIN